MGRNMLHLARSGYSYPTVGRQVRPKHPPDLNRKYAHNLRSRALRWCYGNGIFAGPIKNQSRSLNYVKSLLKLSNAQLFFGVIGDLVVDDFVQGIYAMNPPRDGCQKTPGDKTIRYYLPYPKEIHSMIRSVLAEHGRILPTLQEFLQKNDDCFGRPRPIPGVGANKMNRGPAIPAPATPAPSGRKGKITDFFGRTTLPNAPTNTQDATNNNLMAIDPVEPFTDPSHSEANLTEAARQERDERLNALVYSAQPSPYGDPSYEHMPVEMVRIRFFSWKVIWIFLSLGGRLLMETLVMRMLGLLMGIGVGFTVVMRLRVWLGMILMAMVRGMEGMVDDDEDIENGISMVN